MTNSNRRALIIYNPASGRRKGRRRREIESARQNLHAADIETELAATEGPAHGTELARNAIDAFDFVIACGGDGTINEVVNGLAHSQMPLAILPAGTANILAKELRIPWNIPDAADLIAGSTYRRIALGAIDFLSAKNGPASTRYFMCVAGAGPDGALVRMVPHDVKHHTGQLAYWLEGFRQLALYRFPAFSVRNGKDERQARLLVVGRTKNYGGPFCITTEASLYEDSFELMATDSASPLRYLLWLPTLYFQRLRNDSRVQFWKASEITCETVNGVPVYAQADGEPIGQLPLRFRVAPNALTLCVPETAGSA
jgi:diacylglycerol kinase (ATP)